MTARSNRGGSGERDSGARRRPGLLSDEDVRLWELMKQRLEPLRRAKHRVSAFDAVTAGNTADQTTGRSPPATFEQRSSKVRPQLPASVKPAPPNAPLPMPGAIEHRKSRQIARNQRPIEAVLDLHGMRQREAHAALRAFVLDAHGRGLKFVKVVTGKGYRPDASATAHAVPWSESVHGTGERGVLKRLVPEWLQEQDLRRLVVAFSSAGRGHGGEGALYVEIRRKGRQR